MKQMNRIRNAIFQKFSEFTKHNNAYYRLEVPAKKFQKNSQGNPLVHWTIVGGDLHQREELERFVPYAKFDTDLINSVRLLPAEGKIHPKIEFELQPKAFVEDVLLQDDTLTSFLPGLQDRHVIFEYSSPNIAKPFHVGHLRSTIIGNVLANLHKHLGYKVTKINYLGDWGTQLGMLQVGVELCGVTETQMHDHPIRTLYAAYVGANEAAKSDPTITEKARKYFTDLESGRNAQLAEQWQLYRGYTIEELERTYARLGVQFDQYEWESQYSQKQIHDVLERLSDKALLLPENDGRKVVEVDGRRVPIIKSDGSTLYLARDVAALVDRFARYKFDDIFYVVDNGQSDHFNTLFKTTAALCPEMPPERMHHVKFGRIHGMSTRSGQAVFLSDVLDEARDIMLEKQLNSPTTKIDLRADSEDFKNVADVLGVSAVLVNDLKQRRQRDYDFDWQRALQVNGDTGIKLQYTHCRLHSLLEITDVGPMVDESKSKLSVEHLQEPEAQELLYDISRLEQTLWLAKEQLEPCVLVNYLFALCNSISRALKRLPVKRETCESKQFNRILLFRGAKLALNKGMRVLGLRPLNQM